MLELRIGAERCALEAGGSRETSLGIRQARRCTPSVERQPHGGASPSIFLTAAPLWIHRFRLTALKPKLEHVSKRTVGTGVENKPDAAANDEPSRRFRRREINEEETMHPSIRQVRTFVFAAIAFTATAVAGLALAPDQAAAADH